MTASRLGRGIRATAQDAETAQLMGVNIDRVVALTFLLGGILAGAAGFLFVIFFEAARFNIGFLPGIKAFTAAVLGGIGNIRGALLGGLLLGLLENYGSTVFGGRVEGRVRLRGAGARAACSGRAACSARASGGPGHDDRIRLPKLPIVEPVGRAWDRLPWWGKSLVFIAILALGVVVPDHPRAATGRASCSSRSGCTSCSPSGLNIVVGLTGLLDLGYVAFFAVGAYTTAKLTTDGGLAHGVGGPARWPSRWRWWPGVILGAPDPAPARRLPGHRHARLRRDRAHLGPEQPEPRRGARHHRHPPPVEPSAARVRHQAAALLLPRPGRDRRRRSCSWRG